MAPYSTWRCFCWLRTSAYWKMDWVSCEQFFPGTLCEMFAVPRTSWKYNVKCSNNCRCSIYGPGWGSWKMSDPHHNDSVETLSIHFECYRTSKPKLPPHDSASNSIICMCSLIVSAGYSKCHLYTVHESLQQEQNPHAWPSLLTWPGMVKRAVDRCKRMNSILKMLHHQNPSKIQKALPEQFKPFPE